MDNSFKDKVLEAIDIVDVVGERVALTRKGKDYVGLCPFHPDHKPSMSVSATKRIFKCWSCGAGGDVIHFVQKFERVEFRDALAALARRAGIELHSSPANRRAAQARDELLSASTWARQHFQRNLQTTVGGRRAREYAQQRGLSDQTIERFGIGFAADAWDDVLNAARRANVRPEILQQAGLIASNETGRTYDRFRNRLVFPISDALGRTIAFGGRTLGDDPAKYLNSPETALFSKSRVLYGLHQARPAIEKQSAAIVVEGYMDAVLLSQYGFEHVVATLGTSLSEAHVKLLRPIADRVFLCFDSDQPGVQAAGRAVEIALRTQMHVLVVPLADKDPADCVVASGSAGFQAQLTKAVDALEFRWSQALRTFGQSDPRGRRAALEEFVQFVASASAAGGVRPLELDLLVNRLSQLLSVPAEEVFDLIASAKRSLRRSSSVATSSSAGVSGYEAALRGLGGGLITTVESILGLLVMECECWQWVDDAVAHATNHSETWKHLYRVLLEVHHDLGEYSMGDVVARCDDSDVCELLSRAVARVREAELTAQSFQAIHARLVSELDVLNMNDLRNDLHAARTDSAPGHVEFESLREMARRHDGPMAPERRWTSKPAAI